MVNELYVTESTYSKFDSLKISTYYIKKSGNNQIGVFMVSPVGYAEWKLELIKYVGIAHK